MTRIWLLALVLFAGCETCTCGPNGTFKYHGGTSQGVLACSAACRK